MWSDLTNPWQVCLELAWEAYCNDCIPIGAVVTDAGGEIISRGRNRVYQKSFPGGHSNGQPLAHAEVEALQGVDYDAFDPHTCILYTTTEPCPMCMGAAVGARLGRLVFACRDPKAGAAVSLYQLGNDPRLNHRLIVTEGVCHAEASGLLSGFFSALRACA